LPRPRTRPRAPSPRGSTRRTPSWSSGTPRRCARPRWRRRARRSWPTPNGRPRWRPPSGVPARRRWRSGCGARTAPVPCWPRAMGDMALADDLQHARELVAAHPDLRAVTPDGDVVGTWAAAGGSTKAQSYIEVQAAVDEARQRRTEAATRLEELRARLDGARA